MPVIRALACTMVYPPSAANRGGGVDHGARGGCLCQPHAGRIQGVVVGDDGGNFGARACPAHVVVVDIRTAPQAVDFTYVIFFFGGGVIVAGDTFLFALNFPNACLCCCCCENKDTA